MSCRCIAGYQSPSGSICLTACPVQYYFANVTSKKCESCDLSCVRCTSNLNSACQECREQYFLTNGTYCLPSCYDHFYKNYTHKLCSACSLSCKTCQYRSTYCTSCSDGQLLQNNACISQCSTGFFLQASTSSCQKCTNYCETCKDYSDYCLSCVIGTFFHMNACI